MSTDTPAAAPTAEREAFERWVKSPPYEYDTSRFPADPAKFAWPGLYRDIMIELAWEAWSARAVLPAPVAAWLHEDGTRVLTAEQVETMRRGGGASASTAKGYTIPLGRMEAAQPSASGVDAQWVATAMKLAEQMRYMGSWGEPGYDGGATRERLRTHLFTALTGAAKDVK